MNHFSWCPPKKILRIWAKLWTYTTWIESVLPAGEARERFLRQLVDEALNEMRTEAYWNTEFTCFFLKTRVLLQKIFLGVFNIVSVNINMADGFVRSFTISNDILGRSQIWDHYRFGQLIPTHPNWTPFCNYKWFVLFWQKALEVSSAFPTIICSRDIIETIGHVFGKKPCKSCNKKHDQISVPVYV